MVKLTVTDIDPDVIREFVEYSEESPSCLVWKVYRQKVKKGQKAGHLNKLNYWRIRLNKKHLQVHRVIWVLFNGRIPDEMEINHINCDSSDNKIANLELVSGRQNNRKQKCQTSSILRINNTSGITGVAEYKHNRINPTYYAIASYKDIDAKPKSKSFSYNKYGKEEAWRLASIFIADKRLEIDNEINKGTKMQPHPSTIPVSPWVEVLKGAKINLPVLKGKPKMNKNQEQFTKAEIDYLKDKLSSVIQSHEWSMKEHKCWAEAFKSVGDSAYAKTEFNTVGKMQKELKKLAELQRKIKRMR